MIGLWSSIEYFYDFSYEQDPLKDLLQILARRKSIYMCRMLNVGTAL